MARPKYGGSKLPRKRRKVVYGGGKVPFRAPPSLFNRDVADAKNLFARFPGTGFSTPAPGGGFVASKLPPIPTGPPAAKPDPFYGYLSPAEIAARARQEALLSTSAGRAELLRQQKADELKNRQRAASVQGFSTAAAAMQAGIAPTVGAAYSNAARDQATFGKGFSDGLRMQQGENAATQNQFLAGIGAPQGQMLTGDKGAANFLYGLGGYIPASTLNREGAAFSAAAAAYPVATLGQGKIDLQRTLLEGDARSKEYDARLRELATRTDEIGVAARARLRDEQYRRKTYADTVAERKEATAFQRKSYAEQRADRKLEQEYNRIYQANVLAQKDREQEIQQGIIDRQLARDDDDRARAYTQTNGYLSDADGRPVLIGGKRQYTSATLEAERTADRLERASEATITGVDPVTGEATSTVEQKALDRAARQAAAKKKTVNVHAKQVKARTSAWVALDKAAVRAGKSGLGKPKTNKGFGDIESGPSYKYRYLKADGTGTNDPKLAVQEGRRNGDTVLTELYRAYGASIERYGVPKERVLARIRKTLRGLGYKVK